MRLFCFAILIGLLILACSSDNVFDPTIIKADGFRGITYTNDSGLIIGPIDNSDWQFYGGHSQYLYMPKLNSAQKVLPTTFKIIPAYPNPFSDSISIKFALPVASNINIVIIDENQQTVFKEKDYHEAGIASINWDGLNDKGQRMPDGLYRVVYDIALGPYTGFGDVWLTSNLL